MLTMKWITHNVSNKKQHFCKNYNKIAMLIVCCK